MGQMFFSSADEHPWVTLANGNRRRVILHTEELMLVEFAFPRGGVGAVHSHPHVQATYVAEGVFEVTIDGMTETLQQGQSFIVPSGLIHQIRAIEAGRLIDSFTPARADFLLGEQSSRE